LLDVYPLSEALILNRAFNLLGHVGVKFQRAMVLFDYIQLSNKFCMQTTSIGVKTALIGVKTALIGVKTALIGVKTALIGVKTALIGL